MRHAFADDDLRNARNHLLTRQAELRDRLVRVRRDLARETEPLPKDFSDAAIVLENDEILVAIEQNAVTELDRIRRALERMETGIFAICDQCGGEIGAERLRVVPYASRCLKCEAA